MKYFFHSKVESFVKVRKLCRIPKTCSGWKREADPPLQISFSGFLPTRGWDGGIGWLVWGNGGNCWRESVSLTQWVGMITKTHCATGRTFIKDGDVEVGDQSRFVNPKSEKVFFILFVLVYAERATHGLKYEHFKKTKTFLRIFN